jgi:hypothetical protein
MNGTQLEFDFSLAEVDTIGDTIIYWADEPRFLDRAVVDYWRPKYEPIEDEE